MKKTSDKGKRIDSEKRISFSDGLKIVQLIKRKLEEFNKTKSASSSSFNDYPL